MDSYHLGKCKICGEYRALKDEVCSECKDKDLPDFMKELFGGFKTEENKCSG